MQTKDIPPNRRQCCSKSQQQCHQRARAMNPQGRFQSVTRLPKPVSTQDLTSFSNIHNNPSTQLSSTQLAPPKRMDLHPSLPCSPSGNPSPSRTPVHLVQNLHARTLKTHSCEHMPSISDMQASNHGWITLAISTTNKTMVVLQWSDFLSQAKRE
jgi:hypothetical protein